jgi:hypothetical protein
MREGGGGSGKQRSPHSQQGRSPRRQQQRQHQPQQPVGSSAAHQISGYIMPPHQQQQMQFGGGYGVYPPPQPGQMYHQIPPAGPQHLHQPPQLYTATAVGGAGAGMPGQMPMGQSQAYPSNMQVHQLPPQPMQHETYLQPRPGRLPADRPIMKLSVGLIETYKQINQVRIADGFANVALICLIRKFFFL